MEDYESHASPYDDGPMRDPTVGTILASRAGASGDRPYTFYGLEGRAVSFAGTDRIANAVYRDGAEDSCFVDGAGEVIRRRGGNVSSVQIQSAATDHDAVAQAAAFPVPADEGGEDEEGW